MKINKSFRLNFMVDAYFSYSARCGSERNRLGTAATGQSYRRRYCTHNVVIGVSVSSPATTRHALMSSQSSSVRPQSRSTLKFTTGGGQFNTG